MTSRAIVAKWKSKCALCGEWIEPGEEVYWDKEVEDPKKRITHSPRCPMQDEPMMKELPPKVVETDDLPF